MKILYFCTFYHRALLFRQQMDGMIRRGHEMRAFSTARYGEGIKDKFLPIMDDLVIHKECWNTVDWHLFYPRQWKIEKELLKAYDLTQFDGIHSHLMLSTGYSSMRMKKRFGIPYVVTVRVTDLIGFIRLPYFRRMSLKILREASGVMFLSGTHKTELIRRIPAAEEVIRDKSIILGNPLELFWEEHTSVPRTVDLNQEGRTLKVLCVAKIQPVKNIVTAAKAVAVLNQRGISAELTVVGENQDNKEYEKIRACSYVTMLPFMTKEELIGQYESHDLFLLPSRLETFGRTYVEAMSQGLPVLYTEGQGFDKMFPDGQVGYPVSPDDPEQIADRMQDVMQNYAELSANCIEGCKRFYDENIMDQLENFYENSFTIVS